MSEERDEQADCEEPEPEPTEGDEVFRVPPAGVNEEGLPRMRMSELRDAAADSEHPRHKEALEIGRRMAKSFSESIPKLDMTDQIRRLTDSITPLKEMTPLDLNGIYSNLGIKMPDVKGLVPEMKIPDYFERDLLPRPEALAQPAIDGSWHEDVAAGIAEQKAIEEERDVATLAFMQRVAEGIEAQNEKLDAAAETAARSEMASAKRDARNAWIAGLTLFATVTGIGVSIWIGFAANH